jgi:hypothetical protein
MENLNCPPRVGLKIHFLSGAVQTPDVRLSGSGVVQPDESKVKVKADVY